MEEKENKPERELARLFVSPGKPKYFGERHDVFFRKMNYSVYLERLNNYPERNKYNPPLGTEDYFDCWEFYVEQKSKFVMEGNAFIKKRSTLNVSWDHAYNLRKGHKLLDSAKNKSAYWYTDNSMCNHSREIIANKHEISLDKAASKLELLINKTPEVLKPEIKNKSEKNKKIKMSEILLPEQSRGFWSWLASEMYIDTILHDNIYYRLEQPRFCEIKSTLRSKIVKSLGLSNLEIQGG